MIAVMKILRTVSVCIGLIGCAASMNSADEADNSDGVADTTSEWGYTPLDFYRQCTDVECDFRMFEGEKMLRGLSTWHPRDTGFSFVGDPVLISVTDEFAAHPDVPVVCYSVSLLGYWDADARIFLAVKGEYGIFGLTQAESESETLPVSDVASQAFLFEKRIMNGNWKPFDITLRTLKHRGRLDFSIRKEGSGQAVFYSIEVDGEMDCPANAEEVDSPANVEEVD
jgi:hypothetical protein